MKLKLQHIFLTFLLALTAPVGLPVANAQDASLIADPYDTHSYSEKITYSPGGETEPVSGNDPKPKSALIKDSTVASTTQSTHRVTKTPNENLKPSQVKKQNKEEEDESILSFNFLYYIIQKYKLQDIVD